MYGDGELNLICSTDFAESSQLVEQLVAYVKVDEQRPDAEPVDGNTSVFETWRQRRETSAMCQLRDCSTFVQL